MRGRELEPEPAAPHGRREAEVRPVAHVRHRGPSQVDGVTPARAQHHFLIHAHALHADLRARLRVVVDPLLLQVEAVADVPGVELPPPRLEIGYSITPTAWSSKIRSVWIASVMVSCVSRQPHPASGRGCGRRSRPSSTGRRGSRSRPARRCPSRRRWPAPPPTAGGPQHVAPVGGHRPGDGRAEPVHGHAQRRHAHVVQRQPGLYGSTGNSSTPGSPRIGSSR
jgi:hypothetical protein